MVMQRGKENVEKLHQRLGFIPGPFPEGGGREKEGGMGILC